MSDTRSQIGDALAEKLTPEQLTKLVDEVLETTKSARGWCKECNHQVWVDIPDAPGVTRAMEILLNQAKGKPQDQKSAVEPITFVRRSLPPAA